MMRDDYQHTRFNQRSKRRKTNLILNGLIGIVLVLIIVVSAFIFLGDNNKATTEKENEQSVETSSAADDEESTKEETEESNSETNEEDSSTDSSSSNEEESNDEEASSSDNGEAVVTEGGANANVVRTIVNPSWKPVGTVQTGEHATVYEGVDWDEMVSAIEYATGLSEDNMTIQFLGNDGHNKSKGTVFSKDKTQIYRVSIEWVDGEGWKPTIVEELAAIE